MTGHGTRGCSCDGGDGVGTMSFASNETHTPPSPLPPYPPKPSAASHDCTIKSRDPLCLAHHHRACTSCVVLERCGRVCAGVRHGLHLANLKYPRIVQVPASKSSKSTAYGRNMRGGGGQVTTHHCCVQDDACPPVCDGQRWFGRWRSWILQVHPVLHPATTKRRGTPTHTHTHNRHHHRFTACAHRQETKRRARYED